MTPCSPTSRRSQRRMSPSNSPSMRSVPDTIRVPRMLEPTPIHVLGAGGSSSTGLRVRNFIIGFPSLALVSPDNWNVAVRCEALAGPKLRDEPLENTPGFEQTLEILLTVVLELDTPALATGMD